MRKNLSILVAIFLCAIIVYGGSGVNVYLSCGDVCRDGSNRATSSTHGCGTDSGENKCGCAHSSGDAGQGCCALPKAAGNNPHQNPACKVERVAVNWQQAQSEKLIADPVSFFLFSDVMQFIPNDLETVATIAPWQVTASQKPPNLSRDTYFSLLNFLII